MKVDRYAIKNDHAGDGEPVDAAIGRLAGRQRGYVTRQQLLALGLTTAAISRRIKSGRLIPVYAGVYAVGHLPTLPQDRAAGALLACGSDAVLSHGSAATIWGIFERWEMPFEVTVRTARRREGIRVHRAALARQDLDRQFGLRVTSPARTLLDLAPRLTDKALARAVNNLRQKRLLRLHQLAEVLARNPRAPGAARLNRFLDAPSGPTRSELEDAFLPFARRFGLPQPLVNVRIGGYIVDILFPEERVIVELDGWDFHNSRESFESDRERDAAQLALGYITIRITYERLTHHPEREAERLLGLLRSRRAMSKTLTDL